MPDTLLTTSDDAEGRHEAYQIEERIAVGPAGIVYRALQSGTNREVVFKVLNPDATHPLDAARVRSIKSSVKAMRQRWIAEWIDAYDDPDGFVLVHEYKKGIAGNMFPNEQRRISPADARRLAVQFCEVLQAAEVAALPHGDIKPSNIIIWHDDAQALSLQVLDWGLSICRAQHPPESLDCMSPERLSGGAPSLKGDMFSIGVTLTFLLTGYFPVLGGNAQENIAAWQKFNAASLAQLRPDLDENFIKWIAWLMSFEAKDRPATATQALEALNETGAAATTAQGALPAANVPAVVPAQTPTTKLRAAPPRAQIAAPTRRISADATHQIKEGEMPPAAPARRSGAKRVMQGVLAVCFIATFAVFSGVWLMERNHLSWKDLLAGRWQRASQTATKSDPVIADATAAPAPSPGPVKTTPAVAASVVPPVKPAASLQMRDPMTYPNNTKINGASGGAGWPGPWRAGDGIIGVKPSRRINGMALGGPVVSNARREVGAFNAVASGGISLVCNIIHPGADGPVLSLDVLTPAGGSGFAPILIVPKGDKLIFSIPKITHTFEIASKGVVRVAAQWNFKLQDNGKYECNLTVHVNPAANYRNRTISAPALLCIMPDFTPPASIELALANIAASKQAAIINDIRIAPNLLEALR